MSDQPVLIQMTDAMIVGPADRLILQCTDPNLPMEVVLQIQQALLDTFGLTDTGAPRALVVVGDAMKVLVQRQVYDHDQAHSFVLLDPENSDEIGRHDR